MTHPAPHADDRLTRLETANRRLRLWVAVLTVAVVLMELVVPLTRKTVTATAFQLAAGGRTRASLAASADGTPALTLYDARGEARLNVGMRADGSPDITLTDADGHIRVALRISEARVPTLFLTDGGGQVRVAMGVPNDGLPTLVLLGDGERVRYMTP